MRAFCFCEWAIEEQIPRCARNDNARDRTKAVDRDRRHASDDRPGRSPSELVSYRVALDAAYQDV
jgi:hypothetical protein